MARACAPGEKFLNIQPIAVRSEPWFERLINKSSTCCSRVPFTRLSSFSSLVNTFPKQWGLTWIPYKTVHVYWVIYRVSVQSLSHVRLFATPWPVALQASLSITNSWSLLSPSSWWCHPTISSSVIPFSSCLQSFLASGSFQMHQFFASGSRSIRVAGVRGSLHSKAKGIASLDAGEYRKMHLWGSKQIVLPGTCVRRVFGFDTSGWIGMTAPFIAHKSYTNWYSLLGICQGLIGPCFRNLLSSGWVPFRASGFKGYCLFQGYFPPGLNLIFICGTHFPFLALRYPKLQDLFVL